MRSSFDPSRFKLRKNQKTNWIKQITFERLFQTQINKNFKILFSKFRTIFSTIFQLDLLDFLILNFQIFRTQFIIFYSFIQTYISLSETIDHLIRYVTE